MPLAWRALQLAKDPDRPGENQDAWCVDAERGVASIADGVTAGIFSGQWADILSASAVADRPDPRDAEAFARWLAERRGDWNESIDTTGLAWYQKAKLRDGAFSTLLWLELLDNGALAENAKQTSRLRAFAVGDSCLFHVRNGRLLKSFPIDSADQLDQSPIVLGSIDLNRDGQIEHGLYEATCRAGDLLIVCTDAVAGWALARYADDDPPDWESCWEIPGDSWRQEIAALRGRRQICCDDSTLVMLEVCSVAVEREPPKEQPSEPTAAAPPTGVPDLGDWRDRVNTISERIYRKMSEKLEQGVDKLHQAKQSAEKALHRFRHGETADADAEDENEA